MHIMRLSLLVCLAVFTLTSCGQQGAPDGGPPDKTPPLVLRTLPTQAERRVQTQSIIIEFNKYINKQSFLPNIFLSPPIPYKLLWSGKEAEIRLNQALDSNTTYALTIGSDYTDWRGNKPDKPFTLMFSTGDDLDSATIKGVAYMPDYTTTKQDGIYIFMYRLPENSAERDTFDIRTHQPKYRTQPTKDGRYEIPALASGTYRVAMVKDEFRDGILDVGVDSYGLLTKDLVLASRATVTANIRMDKAKDTKQPQVVGATAISPQIVRIRFSKKLDSLSIQSQGFSVFDSIYTSSSLAIISAHTLLAAPQQVDVYLEKPLPASGIWRVRALLARDSAGNAISDSLHTATIIQSGTSSSQQNTAQLVLCTLTDSSLGVALQPDVRIAWSQPLAEQSKKKLHPELYAVQTETVESQTFAQSNVLASTTTTIAPAINSVNRTNITATTQSLNTLSTTPSSLTIRRTPISTTAHWLTANVLSITPLQPLNPNSNYELVVHNMGLTSILGKTMRDTTLRRTFRTIDTGPFGSLLGTLRDPIQSSTGSASGSYVIVLQSKDRQTMRSLIRKQTGTFEFHNLPAGAYTLHAFYDLDGNGYHSAGQVQPLIYAERFTVAPAEIVIRQRWTVEGIILDFSK